MKKICPNGHIVRKSYTRKSKNGKHIRVPATCVQYKPMKNRRTKKQRAGGNGLHFEGGDVIVELPYVFVGISAKDSEHGIATDESFVVEVQKALPNVKVIPVHLSNDVLHLDLVFNILPFGNGQAQKSCVVYPNGLRDYSKLKSIFGKIFDKVYTVTEDEKDAFVCNFINTQPNKMIVSNSKEMKNLVKKWRKDSPNLKVSYVDYLWIYSYLGGSIRCSTMPIIRTPTKTDPLPNHFSINNETDPLRVCLVGKATPDKKSAICDKAYSVINEALDRDENSRAELLKKIDQGLESLTKALQKDGVIVIRPDADTLQKIQACNIIFSRDIASVIGDSIFVSDLHLEHRKDEFLAGKFAIDKFFKER